MRCERIQSLPRSTTAGECDERGRVRSEGEEVADAEHGATHRDVGGEQRGTPGGAPGRYACRTAAIRPCAYHQRKSSVEACGPAPGPIYRFTMSNSTPTKSP